MPIPCDPLAEPFSQFEKSDPLRGPIFISLNIECLLLNRTHLFEDFKRESWNERMLLFQEEILKRFGFVTRESETKTGKFKVFLISFNFILNISGSNDITPDYQYIHVSGLIFVLVIAPTSKVRTTLKRLGMGNGSHSSPTNSLKSQKRLKNYYTQQQNSLPQIENYINRHVHGNGENRDSEDESFSGVRRKQSNGYLWQWNHMIQNKKWKSYVINGTDDLFQIRMLKDFREFCSNTDDRLVKFWDECWQEKEKLSILNASKNM